ncbi:beta-1,3-galactosyl-O-glycosyl-glycoprotein beta-1,6-N-acetylglucosaminyltransferase activity [Sparganum proliferum]
MDFQSASISDIEKEFAIGFAIAVFKDINQVARLLRIIYRPHNFYVFHVDRKSSNEFYRAVVEVQKCFGENVHVVPRKQSLDVRWFTFTVLELELISASKLVHMGQWKYLINLTGQELPLRTNLELVLALRALNGSNLVEGTVRRRNSDRVPKVNLSFPVTWVKGGVHAALKREFVEFMLFDPKANAIMEALKTHAYNKCPDEQFFATLVYNPQLGAPGACLRVHESDDDGVDGSRLHHLIRYKKWYVTPTASTTATTSIADHTADALTPPPPSSSTTTTTTTTNRIIPVTALKLGDNYRGISLPNIAEKMFTRIVLNRLNNRLEQGLLPESRCCLHPHRGTTGMIFAAHQIQEKCQEMQSHLFAAFDTVNREGLWKIMQIFSCLESFTQIVRQLPDGMMTGVTDDGAVSGHSR